MSGAPEAVGCPAGAELTTICSCNTITEQPAPHGAHHSITYYQILRQNKGISLQNDANFGLHIVVWFGQVAFDVSFFSGLEKLSNCACRVERLQTGLAL